MVQALRKAAQTAVLAATFFAIFTASALAQEDPPSRVARLNHIEGNVSMEPAGVDDWAPAQVNRPFTTGDYLYTDQGARAELHMDIAVLRMGPHTSFGFLNLNDQAVQIKLSEGDMYFRLHDMTNQTFEVDTPNAAVTLVANGTYRFRIDPNGNMSYVVVREGQAQITGGGQAIELDAGNSVTLSGTDQLAYDVEGAPAPDDFDNWCMQRDTREARLRARRYVPPTVIGYEDLDDYGTWQQASNFGPVWYPSGVPAGWAPYHDGYWTWVDPWGWTWVDAAPWGFAPFHYGRWAYISGRWGWCPGPLAGAYGGGPYVRPYYAPALVAWFGGSHWGASISFGGGPSLGWVPLGYGEPYAPPYVVSQRYFNNVNVSNTRITQTNITNVYNTVYVNKTVYNQQFVNASAPGAVMAMPQSAFASGRPVQQAAMPVRQVNAATLHSAAVVAPAVTPTRQAVAPTIGRPAPRPAPQVIQRPVVAKSAPPTPPAPFTARQQYLQQNAGQLHNYQAMHQALATEAKAVAPVVRTVTAARPVPVHAGARVGNMQTANTQAAPGNQARPSQAPVNQAVRPSGVPQQQRPAEAGQPGAPVAHGTPPNMRPSQSSVQAAQPGTNAAHGTAPSVRPGATTQPMENPRATERTTQNQPAPTNTRVPERAQPQEQPTHIQQQPPAANAHGTPPNVRPGATAQPTENPRVTERTTQEQPPARVQQQPSPPAAHGTPPNMRPGNGGEPGRNPTVNERAQPQSPARPAPEPPQYRGEERPQPQPPARATTEPSARTEARPTPPPPQSRGYERPQPQPPARATTEPSARTEARPTPPPPQHRVEERPQAQPQPRSTPEARPQTEARPVAPPAQEHAGPPPAEHGAPPRDTKDTRDHR